ncbi:hypothetical protein F183_A29420 [Bryobacterales bacterium F-183]|nr:hypothetical protein F183_A29420 [Bryobacterales bacterium F-183]
MAQRSATTFKKRQKEQERKERQQEKFAKRMDRKRGIGVETPGASDQETSHEDGELSPSPVVLP